MEFYLIYKGPLKANGDKNHKYEIRKFFHHQLKKLWESHPVLKAFQGKPGRPDITEKVGNCIFIPLVSDKLKMRAKLNIFMLTQDGIKGVVKGGDIDNRLKTLFDALRCPKTENELPEEGINDIDRYNPMFCLLQDDSLIEDIRVHKEMLLLEEIETFLLIHVEIRITQRIWATADF